MYIKAAHRTLMKLILGVNFTKILQGAFFAQKCYAQFSSAYSLALQFFSRMNIVKKAACKMLLKLTTGSLPPSFVWSPSLLLQPSKLLHTRLPDTFHCK